LFSSDSFIVQVTQDHLNGDMNGKYTDLSSRCQAVLSREVVIPALTTLHSDYTKLCLEWEDVNKLVAAYLAK